MKQNLFFIGLLALMLTAGKGWGQLLIQDFSSSNTVSDYVSATPDNSKFNSISSSGAGTTVTIANETLSYARTENAGSFSRTTDFSPIPSTLQYKLTISVSGNTVQQTTAAVFQVGSEYGTANSAETNAKTYARFGINLTATNGTWQIRDILSTSNSADLIGSQDITWILNNSGSTLTYLSPSNHYETIANDKMDIWAGSTRLFDDVNVLTPSQTMTDLKFAFTEGTGTITVDNFSIDPIPVVWLNNQSSNSWNTPSNWGYGSVPLSTQNVIIPSGGDQPTVNNDIATPANIGKLTINSGATLTVGEGKAISVSGTLTNNAGTSGLVVASGGSLIHSTAAVPGTVQRSITAVSDWNDPASADEGWHLISSPVASQNIDGSWTPAGAGNGYDFYAWSEATNTWLNQKIIGNNITAFEVGKGYIAAYEQTAIRTFTGDLNSANVTVNSLTRTEAEYVDPNDAGFNLVGNPFPSAIRWHGTGVGEVDWSLVNISGVAQVWDRTGKDYAPVNADDLIPSGNGFMVQLTSGTTGSITIPAAAKAHDAQPFYKSSSSSANAIKLVAREADNRSAKRSNIILNAQASNEFDAYLDGRYLAGYGPRFYSLKSGKKLSSYSIPEFNDDMIIPFGFTKNSGDLFVIELLEGIEGKTLYLTDLKLNIKTNLTQEGSYSFTSTEGDDPNRFLLHFGAVGVDEAIPATAVAAYVSNNILYVLNAQGKVQVDVMDISGRLVHSQSLQTTGLSSTPLSLPAGVYVVRLNDGQTSRTNKVIVQ